VLAFAATGKGPFGGGTTASLLYRVVHETPDLDGVPAAVRPLIERCLVKDPAQRPTAVALLDAVGALQPTANWLPESIIRAFERDNPAGPMPATPGTPAPALGSLAASGFVGEAATPVGATAQVPSGESLLLARADNPQTATLRENFAAYGGYASSREYVSSAPARREEPAAAPLVAAAGAGVDHRRSYRGTRSRLRRDHSHRREHVHPDSLPRGG